MKRPSIAALGLVALLTATACSSSGSSSPSSTPTSGTTTTRFVATLSPAQETPAITNAESTGSGVATINMNITRDASGNITAQSVDFTVTMQGFPSTTQVTISHIHVGAAGVAGAIVVNTGLASGDVTLVNGGGSFVKSNIAVDPTLAQQIINNPAGYYFNVHSSANPTGVVRGQLVRTH